MSESQLKPSTRPHPGRVFARRYEVIEQIGSGGMSDIFTARDTERDGVVVALKVVHQDLLHDEEIAQRFAREMEVTSRVRHPNVVKMLAYGSTRQGLGYIVLEYVPGTLLSDLVAEEGKLAPDRVADIARQIASALEAAHAAGIVHRDLKSGNVMMLDGDRLKVLDFGLARFEEGVRAAMITDAGARIGTPEYMAPEYIQLKAPPDHRVDLYALGVLIYEMLTGECPFTGEPPEVFEQHVRSPVPRVAGAPPRLERLMRGLLEKDPERRIQSASEVVARLAPPQNTATRWQLAAIALMAILVLVTISLFLLVTQGVLPR